MYVCTCKETVWNYTQETINGGISKRHFSLNMLRICLNTLP